MKKYIIFGLLILILILTSCSNPVSDVETVTEKTQTNTNQGETNTDLTINEIKYIYNRISVFENVLPKYDNDDFKKISVKTNGADWTVDNIDYKSISVIAAEANSAYWKVDLSKFSPLGVCDDILLFSAKEKSSDSVIVALYGNNMYFLVCDDVLYPDQYSIYDFEIEILEDQNQPKPTEDELLKLWKDHLAGEHNINMVIMEDAPSHIRFRLKNHPELIYNFPYILYYTYYCSPLPFK